ncbi:MAG: phosphatidate cytidylyltransferase [Anaerolineae bacterium]|nr:phosphatidate cytidylyltransferase [Anaerolineae bacterium]MEB2288012.1 phosphatidate cytidylyltransferase [Anaerolineae bacterium]
MLKTRVLTAVVALPILIAVVLVGGWLFAALVVAALVLGGLEYAHLLRQGGYKIPAWLVLALILLLAGATWFEHDDWRAPGVAALLIAGAFYAIWGMEHGQPSPVLALALAVFGGLYVGWLGSYLLAVRDLQEGAYLLLMLYGCVAFSDSAAYFVGRRWGRHKMSPRVSPKKTWEGYFGSVIGGAIFGALAGGLPDTDVLTWGHGALIGLLIGTLGTVGDLAISAIKRQVGAKDSSHLIPGHGGILDRTDSVLVSVAIGYYYLVWFVF